MYGICSLKSLYYICVFKAYQILTQKAKKMTDSNDAGVDIIGKNALRPGEPREPFDSPLDKKEKVKKEKKERIHIYISSDSIGRVDAKASELGLDRSPCIQMLINTALKHIDAK